MKDYPLIVLVGVDEAEYFEAFHQRVKVTILLQDSLQQ